MDHYRHQTTKDFEKLLEQEDVKNISKVATPILLTISMHIEPTRLSKVVSLNVEYDSEGRLRERCTGADWGNDGEIEEAMAADIEKDDDKESS